LCLTTTALVSAMNSIRMLASATQIPILYLFGSMASSRVKPGGQSPPPPPEPGSNGPPGPTASAPSPPRVTFAPVVTVVPILSILDFRFWILDSWSGSDPATNRDLIQTSNPKSKIQNPNSLVSFARRSFRIILHLIVLRRARHAELIRPAIHRGFDPGEVVVRRRGRDRPLERRSFPRIV